MRLICPCCGGIFSAEAGIADASARQALRVISEIPAPAAKACIPYLALFRTVPPLETGGVRGGSKGLRWETAARLLAELSTLIRESHVQAPGKPARPNSVQAWARAMDQVTAHPPRRLPLKNHAYLSAVAWDFADQADRANETRRNALERTGRRIDEMETTERKPITDEQIAKLRAAVRGVGKKVE